MVSERLLTGGVRCLAGRSATERGERESKERVSEVSLGNRGRSSLAEPIEFSSARSRESLQPPRLDRRATDASVGRQRYLCA